MKRVRAVLHDEPDAPVGRGTPQSPSAGPPAPLPAEIDAYGPRWASQPPSFADKALFGTLPHDLAFDGRTHNLDAMEIAVALAITASARRIIRHDEHARSMAAGALAIEQEREHGRKHKEQWKTTKQRRRRGEKARAPLRHHVHKASKWRAGSTSRNVKAAGSFGYKESSTLLRNEERPDAVALTISRSNLLRVAHLSPDGKNLARLDKILCRLARPVSELPPLVSFASPLSSGNINLLVSGEWLAPPYMKIPLPVPTRSRPATLLYMFLRGIRAGPTASGFIRFKDLCERIGIQTDQPWIARQAFDRAKDIVNFQLSRIDTELLRTAHKLTMPGWYVVHNVDDGERISFEGCARQRPHEHQPDATARPKIRHRKSHVTRIRAPDNGARHVLTHEEIRRMDEEKAFARRREHNDRLAARRRRTALLMQDDD